MSKHWIRRTSDVPGARKRSTLAWALCALCVVVLLGLAPAANANESRKGDGDHKPMAGMSEQHGDMHMTGCDREVHLTEAAELQMGGAHFAGTMPAKSKGGMQMASAKGGMKMGGKGMEMAHQDHDAKEGGVLFMAPNETHHIEGTYSTKCGFQLYLYNAFTKPIHVGRFRAFIKVIGEKNGEYAETYQFLTPNEEDSVLQAQPLEGMDGELEIELYVQFPGEAKAEIFNFVVDEHGELS